jgi:hypothetical protein
MSRAIAGSVAAASTPTAANIFKDDLINFLHLSGP